MCDYITFEQYTALGGKADASAFPRLSRLAQKKLDYWTQNRITESDEDIQLCMMLIMDALRKVENGESNIASTSNDGCLSVTHLQGQRSKSWDLCMTRSWKFCP